jgi:hypothetical protein
MKNLDILKQAGVYCIQNALNNHFYIGSSSDLYSRYHNHSSLANNNVKNSTYYHGLLGKTYLEYSSEVWKFQVLMFTTNYLRWEELLINLLKPEYNSSKLYDGKIKPNLGKKFDSAWAKSLGRSTPHSKEVKEKLSKLNKENGCNLKFTKGDQILEFSTWIEAGKYFNTSGKALAQAHRRYGYSKGWKIEKLSKQTKKVKLTSLIKPEKFKIFKSASDCDKFLNLWRGATSNSIKNNNGFISNSIVKYI